MMTKTSVREQIMGLPNWGIDSDAMAMINSALKQAADIAEAREKELLGQIQAYSSDLGVERYQHELTKDAMKKLLAEKAALIAELRDCRIFTADGTALYLADRLANLIAKYEGKP